MKDNIYTIKKLCNDLDQPRHKIRRRLINCDIKAINEDSRTYKNEPLEYDHQVFLKLAEEFNVKVIDKKSISSEQHRTANEQHCTTENNYKDRLINVLEEQLEEANKSKANLEKLLDQQQQLTMISNKKLESLKLELEDSESNKEKEVEAEEKTKKWWQFWK